MPDAVLLCAFIHEGHRTSSISLISKFGKFPKGEGPIERLEGAKHCRIVLFDMTMLFHVFFLQNEDIISSRILKNQASAGLKTL